MGSFCQPPAQVTLIHGQRRHVLEKIGPSMQGWVYAPSDRSACFRLFSMSFDIAEGNRRRSETLPAERRQLFSNWVRDGSSQANRPTWLQAPFAHGIAPVVEAEQADDEQGRHWFFVHYDCHPAQFLCEVLTKERPTDRLARLIQILYRVNGWWEHLHTGLLPLASDIAFDAFGKPFLLPTPHWCLPDVEAIFAEPSRLFALAPEFTCGRTAPGREANMDRYAIGALLMQAFRKTPDVISSSFLLAQSASGQIWSNSALNLPLWMKNLPEVQHCETAIQGLMNPDVKARSAVDYRDVAQKLEACRHGMEPTVAVEQMLAARDFALAHEMARDILLTDDSYEMMVIAGKTAYMADQFLESVDLLERAIARKPERNDAFVAQWRTLTALDSQHEFTRRLAFDSDILQRIDVLVKRDYDYLAKELPESEPEDEMADYMLWQKRYVEATQFIYSKLVGPDGNCARERIALQLRYVRALIGAGAVPTARDALSALSTNLRDCQWQHPELGPIWSTHWQGVQKLNEQLSKLP